MLNTARIGILALFLLFIATFSALADFESQVIELVNIERSANDLPPLIYNEELANAARQHSQDMGENNYFSHTSQDGTAFNQRIVNAGYDYNNCGENIAAGYPTPQDVVNGWMNSPGHRANLLSPDYCDIGVGYAVVAGSEYFHYWTQDFGRQSGVSQCPTSPTPVVTSPETITNLPIETNGSSGGGCFIGTSRINPHQF
jgi:hypothetical protein